jgi:hypothetical protein
MVTLATRAGQNLNEPLKLDLSKTDAGDVDVYFVEKAGNLRKAMSGRRLPSRHSSSTEARPRALRSQYAARPSRSQPALDHSLCR